MPANRTERHWPLLLIAAPAAVAVWSGWVGSAHCAGLGSPAGQVIYHLLAATHAQGAPWPVVVFVSCLPKIAAITGRVDGQRLPRAHGR